MEKMKSSLGRQQAVHPCRRRFLDDFKREAVRLVVEEKYTFAAAARAVGVSTRSLRDWHKKYAQTYSRLRLAQKCPRSKQSKRPSVVRVRWPNSHIAPSIHPKPVLQHQGNRAANHTGAIALTTETRSHGSLEINRGNTSRQ